MVEPRNNKAQCVDISTAICALSQFSTSTPKHTTTSYSNTQITKYSIIDSYNKITSSLFTLFNEHQILW